MFRTIQKSWKIMIFSMLMVLASTANAQQEQRVESFPLAQFMIENRPIELKGSDGSYGLSIPKSHRHDVISMMLHLDYTNSVSLLKERSQLKVKINDLVIAQMALDPQSPRGVADIEIPLSATRDGYNDLVFEASQHYTIKCEDPSATELWSQIDTRQSQITFVYTKRQLQPRLANIPKLFDEKMRGGLDLRILTPSLIYDGTDHLEWGGLLAQGAAIHLNYVPLRIEHKSLKLRDLNKDPIGQGKYRFPSLDPSMLASGDNIIVGTKAELDPYLGGAFLDRVRGAYLGIFPLDDDPTHFVLVVSGRDQKEVRNACLAFGAINYPFPDTEETIIRKIQIPEGGIYPSRWHVQEEKTYTFKELGYQWRTMNGSDEASINVWLAPDVYAREESEVEIRLHMAYGAGFRNDSTLNIFLNGNFEKALYLSDPNGVVFKDYLIKVPFRSFTQGYNRVTFSASMVPLRTGDCELVHKGNLLLNLFPDSEITFPEAEHIVRLPDMNLMSRTTFPFGMRADGLDMAMLVAGKNSQTISAAWTLLAKFAQKAETTLHNASLFFDVPRSMNRNMVIVGSSPRIDEELTEGAPVKLGAINSIPFRALNKPKSTDEDTFTKTAQVVIETVAPSMLDAQGDLVVTDEDSQMGDYGLAMMYESPLKRKRSIFLVTAGNETRLVDAVNRLISPDYWGSLKGDMAIWSEDPEAMAWQKAGDTYDVGESASQHTRTRYFLSNSPWYWVLFMLLVILCFVFLTRYLLVKYKRRRDEKEAVH